jgi:hypothetical protein
MPILIAKFTPLQGTMLFTLVWVVALMTTPAGMWLEGRAEAEALSVLYDTAEVHTSSEIPATYQRVADMFDDGGYELFERVVSLTINGSLSPDLAKRVGAFKHLNYLDLDSDVNCDVLLGSIVARKKLKWLVLSGAGVSDAALEELGDLSAIEAISLDSTAVSDEGLRHLVRYPLQWINLADTSVGDLGLGHFKGHPTLEGLELSTTSVGDAGVEVLVSCPRIWKLHLANSALTDAGVRHLVKMKKLKYLDLSLTRVGNAGASVLVAHRRLGWGAGLELLCHEGQFSDELLEELRGQGVSVRALPPE